MKQHYLEGLGLSIHAQAEDRQALLEKTDELINELIARLNEEDKLIFSELIYLLFFL